MSFLLVFDILAVFAELEEIITNFAISEFKAIMVPAAFGCFNHMREKTEIVSKGKKRIPVNFGFSFGIKIRKNPPVFP